MFTMIDYQCLALSLFKLVLTYNGIDTNKCLSVR